MLIAALPSRKHEAFISIYYCGYASTYVLLSQTAKATQFGRSSWSQDEPKHFKEDQREEQSEVGDAQRILQITRACANDVPYR